MKHETQNLAVWDFLNYREFLKAIYEQKKRQTRGAFSYRIFSQKTGVKSPNYLKLIVDGQRKLTTPHARRVAKYLSLAADETAYFLALVRWNQESKAGEAESLWKEVLQTRSRASHMQLSTAQLAVLTQWKTIVVFELLQTANAVADTAWLASRLRNPIPAEEVEESMRALAAAGLIQCSGNKVKVLKRTLKSADDIPSASIRQFHHQTLKRAADALEAVPVPEREFISVTMGIKTAKLPEIKAHLRALRDLILSQAEAELDSPGGTEEVYQLNLQLFPVTGIRKEKP